MRIASLFAACLLWVAAPAQAATFSEIDDPNMDFQDFRTFGPGADTVGPVVDGYNEIIGRHNGACTGTTSITCNTVPIGPNAGPGDLFRIDFPPDTIITRDVIFEIFVLFAPPGFSAWFNAVSGDPNSNAFLIAPATQGSPMVGGIFGEPSSPINNINFFFGTYANTANTAGAFSYNWRMSFEAAVPAQVPLPAPVLLLLAGLAGLIAMRRRGQCIKP